MTTPKGETRTTSETGGQKGDKILRFDQIPAEPMEELAARYGTGSLKYAQKDGIDNWRHGYAFSLSLAALERHLYAFKRGEDYDDQQYLSILDEGEDTVYDEDGNVRPGVTHLSAVIWHCMFMLYHLQHNPQFDDRPTTVAKRNAEKKSAEMTLEFSFDASAAGQHLVELITGGTITQLRGDLKPTGLAAWPEVGLLSEEDTIPEAFRKQQAPKLPKFQSDEADDEDDFTVARAKHRSLLNEWYNRPTDDDMVKRINAPHVHAISPESPAAQEQVAAFASSPVVTGPGGLPKLKPGPPATPEDREVAARMVDHMQEIKRLDEWMVEYGDEILDFDGFAGLDTYTEITRREYLAGLPLCTMKYNFSRHAELDGGYGKQ